MNMCASAWYMRAYLRERKCVCVHVRACACACACACGFACAGVQLNERVSLRVRRLVNRLLHLCSAIQRMDVFGSKVNCNQAANHEYQQIEQQKSKTNKGISGEVDV